MEEPHQGPDTPKGQLITHGLAELPWFPKLSLLMGKPPGIDATQHVPSSLNHLALRVSSRV